MKTGLIYQEGAQKQEVNISWAVVTFRFLARILSWTGLGLILVSIFGLVFVYIPLGMAEVHYAFSKTEIAKLARTAEKQDWGRKQEEKKQQEKLAGKKITSDLPTEWAVPDVNYSIYIPKIFANSKVIPNVDAGDPKMYLSALKRGVAEAANLAHPGEIGTTYLFAHSVGTQLDFARYNAVFYLLDKLTTGDAIEIVFQGKWYKYAVVDRQILAATDTQYLVPQKQSEKLVLQTCYPPGTSWKRLVIVASRI